MLVYFRIKKIIIYKDFKILKKKLKILEILKNTWQYLKRLDNCEKYLKIDAYSLKNFKTLENTRIYSKILESTENN